VIKRKEKGTVKEQIYQNTQRMVQLSVHAMKTYGGVEVWRWRHSLFSVLGKWVPQRVLTHLKGENISGDISSFLGCLTLEDGTETVPKGAKRPPTSRKNDSLKYQITLHYILFTHENN